MCVKHKKEWLCEFATEPPLTTANICEKFEANGEVHDEHMQRCWRPYTAMGPTSSAMVLEQFTVPTKGCNTMCT